jgi:hypothetical protein
MYFADGGMMADAMNQIFSGKAVVSRASMWLMGGIICGLASIVIPILYVVDAAFSIKATLERRLAAIQSIEYDLLNTRTQASKAA